jgi:predicted TIM-barrel fold metal-dependent hydrolase
MLAAGREFARKCGTPYGEAEPMFERPSPSRFDVPSGNCDCHVHLFGPFERYPLDLTAGGRVWVKLSGTYRVSEDIYGNAQVTALARALIAANRERVVWASDWPDIGSHPHRTDGEPPHADYRRIDYGRLLSVLADWAVPDDIARILARNPARLYDFA